MSTLESVNQFMAQKHIAVAGVSRKKQKFGNAIYKELNKKGYNLYPVNPNLDQYNGSKCYPEITKKLIVEAEAKGIKNIWLQQGSADKDTILKAEESESNIISKQCVIMFADPTKGIHGFHKWINKIFGMLPK